MTIDVANVTSCQQAVITVAPVEPGGPWHSAQSIS